MHQALDRDVQLGIGISRLAAIGAPVELPFRNWNFAGRPVGGHPPGISPPTRSLLRAMPTAQL